jgi:hypothetical protein
VIFVLVEMGIQAHALVATAVGIALNLAEVAEKRVEVWLRKREKVVFFYTVHCMLEIVHVF